MGFTKLNQGIVHSSVWSYASDTRVLWVTILALCNSEGFVPSSRSGLLRAANIPEDKFEIGLSTLESPDSDSRSSEYDGRRIEKCEGGWMVLNYKKYREFTYSGSPSAKRQKKYRERLEKRNALQSDVTGLSSASVLIKSKNKCAVDYRFENFWSRYPKKTGKIDASKAYLAAIKDGATEEELFNALQGYLAKIDQDGTTEKFIRHPATFLRSERWKDTLPPKKMTKEEYDAAREEAEKE